MNLAVRSRLFLYPKSQCLFVNTTLLAQNASLMTVFSYNESQLWSILGLLWDNAVTNVMMTISNARHSLATRHSLRGQGSGRSLAGH
jgi:hypothetical protein